jgi:hypothetical protein
VVALALELTDDDQRQDDGVLVEPGHRPRVGKQYGRVENIGTTQVTRARRGTRSGHGNSQANATPTSAPRRARHPPRLGDQVGVANLLDADRVAHEGRVPALSIVTITTWASRDGAVGTTRHFGRYPRLPLPNRQPRR